MTYHIQIDGPEESQRVELDDASGAQVLNSLVPYLADRIDPEQLVAYLRSAGWKQVRALSNIQVFGLQDIEVLVPLRPDFKDYSRMVVWAIESIAASMECSVWECYQNIQKTSREHPFAAGWKALEGRDRESICRAIQTRSDELKADGES